MALSFHLRERRYREQRLTDDAIAFSIGDPSAEPSEEVRLLLFCIDDLSPLDEALVLL
ncbi:MAG: hypothetical protein ACI8QS_002888 [Planctomycetota bacterium]